MSQMPKEGEEKLETTPSLDREEITPETSPEPVETAGKPPAVKLPDLRGRLASIPMWVWLVASVLGLLVILLVAVSVTALSLQQANAATKSSLESSMASQVQTLRNEFQTADKKLQDDWQKALEAQNQTWRKELQAGLDQAAQTSETNLAQVHLETMLLRASRQALQARIHLAEKDPGLAKRNLRDVETTLTAAIQATSDKELQATMGRLRSSIAELRDSIEAQTFPVTTVEVLIDEMDRVIQQLSTGQ